MPKNYQNIGRQARHGTKCVMADHLKISALIGYNGSTRRWFWKLIFIQKCQAYTLDKYFSRTGNFWTLANSKNIVGWSNQRRHVIFEISGHFVLELKWLLFGGFRKKLEDYKTSEVRFCNLSRVKRLFSFQNLFFSSPPAKLGFFTKTPNFLKSFKNQIVHKNSEFSQNHAKTRFFTKTPIFIKIDTITGFFSKIWENPGFFYSKVNLREKWMILVP